MGYGARKMIKFYIWCVIVLPIIGQIYGFFTGDNDIFLFSSGMLHMLLILMVMAWFVEDRNEKC